MTTRAFSMTEDSEYVLEPLRERADFTLYRGRERGNQMPILAVAVASEQPSPQSLRRLEHEYSLATELDAAWAAQPLALTRHQARAVLILKDPGGEPLDRVIEQHKGQKIDLTRSCALPSARRQHLAKPISKASSIRTSSLRTHLSTTPGTCGSPAPGSRPNCDTSVRCPCRRRSSPAPSPIWRLSRPVG